MKKNYRRFSLSKLFTTLAVTLALIGLCLVEPPVSARAGMVRSTRAGNQSFPAIGPALAVLPPDLPAAPAATTLTQAATFAWKEFIALNWPAQTGKRDTADTTKMFGDQSVPLVWQTFRAKVEIYPGNGNEKIGPHGSNKGPSQDYGYDDPPEYIYSKDSVINGSDVLPCSGQAAPNQPAWINLDEVSQIGSDSMYAGFGQDPAPTPTNSKPNLFRYMAKANRTEYTYVVSNQYWYTQGTDPSVSSPLQTAQNNFVKNVVNKRRIPPLGASTVFFPASSAQDPGTIEVKAAWRPLGPSEPAGRYHVANVRYYERDLTQKFCYREDQWALLALHIIRKTPKAPSFIYATFEQADNIRDGNGAPIENPDGSVIHPPPPSPPTNPALTYTDHPKHATLTAASTTCTPGGQLYYQNIHESNATKTPVNPGLPSGTICVNYRDNAIPSDVIAVNKAAQVAINRYNHSAPWQYYKLVNVQWQPIPYREINYLDPNAPYNAATYHQANVVVETDYPLQMFNGRFPAYGVNTNYKTNGKLYFQNVYTLHGTKVKSFDMGGCMGCHGSGAQRFGADFSFILGSPVTAPETPDDYSLAAIAQKYKALFERH
ncbi:MAG TPA: hypothetical protein VF173_05000 [Thermoanaerobaculia bacterium]|nr:hypothetical protein [Thermoanaerobaculia bacterium]